MEELLIAAVIVFVAGFIQGIVGFGSAMIAVSLLSVYLDIKLVIPLVALLSMIIVSIITFQLRNHFEYKKIHPLVIGSLVGIPLGAYFLKNMDGNIVRIILGILLTTYGIYQLLNLGCPNSGKAPLAFYRESDKNSGMKTRHAMVSFKLYTQ